MSIANPAAARELLAAAKKTHGSNRAVAVLLDRAESQVSGWLKGESISRMTAEHIIRVLSPASDSPAP